MRVRRWIPSPRTRGVVDSLSAQLWTQHRRQMAGERHGLLAFWRQRLQDKTLGRLPESLLGFTTLPHGVQQCFDGPILRYGKF